MKTGGKRDVGNRAAMGRNGLPEGFRIQGFAEAEQACWLRDELMSLFRRWGYRQVITPALDYYDAFEGETAELYKLVDRRGEILVLRPDITVQVARLVAGLPDAFPLPLRLSYAGNVYRSRPGGAGRPHEFGQAGVELVGASTATADAEIVALMAAALDRIGLAGYRIGIGHAGFIDGVLASVGVDGEVMTRVRQALAVRDYVGLEEIAGGPLRGTEAAALLGSLPTLRGGPEVLDAARGLTADERAQEALDRLEGIHSLLRAHGAAGNVYYDLGLVRELGYYTGMICEAYAPASGAALGGGGRYDGLLRQYGRPAPATGFALNEAETLAALTRLNAGLGPGGLDYLLVPAPGCDGLAISKARSLRRRGYSVEILPMPLSGEETDAYAEARRARNVLYIDERGYMERTQGSVGRQSPGEEEKALPRAIAGIH